MDQVPLQQSLHLEQTEYIWNMWGIAASSFWPSLDPIWTVE